MTYSPLNIACINSRSAIRNAARPRAGTCKGRRRRLVSLGKASGDWRILYPVSSGAQHSAARCYFSPVWTRLSRFAPGKYLGSGLRQFACQPQASAKKVGRPGRSERAACEAPFDCQISAHLRLRIGRRIWRARILWILHGRISRRRGARRLRRSGRRLEVVLVHPDRRLLSQVSQFRLQPLLA